MEKIGATPIGNGNLDAIGERKRRLVKNPNMDYRNLYATNLFRDIMIILVVNDQERWTRRDSNRRLLL